MKATAKGLTDVGRRRENNQDSLLVDVERQVYAIADGMGGHAAGEVASKLAIEALDETFRDHDPAAAAAGSGPDEVARLLEQAFIEGNRRICDSAVARGELRGMGTTIVALVPTGDTAVIGYVGDSRAYRLRAGLLEQLTDDHSWVGEQVRAGHLSSEEAQRHPMRNIVTRALGNRIELQSDVVTVKVQSGDVLLLCSDGLNTMLVDDEIRTALSAGLPDPADACRALVDGANERGGDDNVTVIVWSASNDEGP